jgi:phospholipase/carboxylesterase
MSVIEVQTGAQPTASVIWLHGLGADGSDFEPIVPALELPASLAVRFVFPNAPVMPVTINNGMQMPAWYDIRALHGADEDEEGIRHSQESLEQLIAAENKRGIPTERVVLAGFSQGGAIALQTGLRTKEKIAGIMALSTYLPLAASLGEEKSATNQQVPILMVHGEHDEMISLDRADRSKALIEEQGFTVNWHQFPMGHEVIMPEVQLISQWLQQVLK